MADVFLSYKSEDRVLAQGVARALEREGFTVWWDRKINAGGGWRETILRELGASKAVIAAWSRHTEDIEAASWMLNEVDEAARLGRPVIPVMLQRCEAPFGYRHVQAADLSDWQGEAAHAEWRQVLDAVRAAVSGRANRVSPVPLTGALRRKRGKSGASALISLGLVAAAVFAWREFGAAREEAPASIAAEAPAPRVVASPDAEAAVRADPRVMLVRFVGANGERGMFRRTESGDWIERSAAEGVAGRYHVNRENAEIIVLHDGERGLSARIDLDRGLIAVREAGEEHFHERYRIVSVDGGRRLDAM